MGATVCDGIVALARVVGAVRGHRAEFNISRDLVEELRQHWRVGVGRTFFLTLHERLHVGGRDEPDIVTELRQFPSQNCAPPQASIATRQGGNLLKNSIT